MPFLVALNRHFNVSTTMIIAFSTYLTEIIASAINLEVQGLKIVIE